MFKFVVQVRKNFFIKMYGKGRLKRWYGMERVRSECYERVQGCMLSRGRGGGGVGRGWKLLEEGGGKPQAERRLS